MKYLYPLIIINSSYQIKPPRNGHCSQFWNKQHVIHPPTPSTIHYYDTDETKTSWKQRHTSESFYIRTFVALGHQKLMCNISVEYRPIHVPPQITIQNVKCLYTLQIHISSHIINPPKMNFISHQIDMNIVPNVNQYTYHHW